MKSSQSFHISCVVSVLVALLSARSGLASERPAIVRNGEPNAAIIIADPAPRMTRIAAQELQTHIEKISGARLGIVHEPSGDVAVRIFVGDSPGAEAVGVTSKGLEGGAFRMVAGDDWLALVGDDTDFEPIEPWARSYSNWRDQKLREWDELTGAKWSNHMGDRTYRAYTGKAWHYDNSTAEERRAADPIEVWSFDKRGSPNAVYAFLRDMGVRWYAPGELGTVLPKQDTIALPTVDRTVRPDLKIRQMSWDRYNTLSRNRDQLLWSLRLGLNEIRAPMHHGIANVTRRAEQRQQYPEIYQIRNGQRDTESERPKACLSSEELFQQNVRFVRTMMDHYGAPVVSVMPQDGFTRICECEQCAPQATPERGPRGRFSDYVWHYVNRVAAEVAKTNPDGKIICGAYSTYQLPPMTIDKLHPNVLVQITNGRPRYELDADWRKQMDELQQAWLEKTDNPLSITINYHIGYRPFYNPHVVAQGMSDANGRLWREDLWYHPFTKTGLYEPGVTHLNVWLTSRLWWDQTRGVEPMLEEYYRLYYGPAEQQMKHFINYCEQNYGALTEDKAVVDRALELFDAAQAQVSPGSVYGKRLALVDDYLSELRKRRDQLGKGREDVPVFSRTIQMSKNKFRDARETFELDGRIEEPFWTTYLHGAGLRELRTGESPTFGTRFYTRWYNDQLYIAIRCEDASDDPANITTTEDDDWAIWDGDHVEILLETDEHAYYQLVVNPAGALVDLDRGVRKANWFNWSSQAEVAAHIGEDYWSVEMRLPVTSSANDPLHQVIGNPPSRTMPWFFNICRKRVRGDRVELSAYSPTGEKDFHATEKFGKIFLR